MGGLVTAYGVEVCVLCVLYLVFGRVGRLGLIVLLLHVHVYCVLLVGTGDSRVVTNPVVLD